MEFMENVFDALCSAVSEPNIKELFLKSEGVDLMVLMMKSVSLWQQYKKHLLTAL